MHIDFPSNKKNPNPKSYQELETGGCSVPLLSPIVVYLPSIRAELSQSGHSAGIYRTGRFWGAGSCRDGRSGGRWAGGAGRAATSDPQRRVTACPPRAVPAVPRVAPAARWQLQLPGLPCQLSSSAFGQPRRQRTPALLAPRVAGSPGAPGGTRALPATSGHPPDAPPAAGRDLPSLVPSSNVLWLSFHTSAPILFSRSDQRNLGVPHPGR